MATLDALYHLAPSEHDQSIAQHGLRILEPVSDGTRQPDGSPVAFPWVCLATTAQDAWMLLPRDAREEVEEWTVWQAWLHDSDRFEIRSDLGLRIREVRVMHGLPPDRLWMVGRRRS